MLIDFRLNSEQILFSTQQLFQVFQFGFFSFKQAFIKFFVLFVCFNEFIQRIEIRMDIYRIQCGSIVTCKGIINNIKHGLFTKILNRFRSNPNILAICASNSASIVLLRSILDTVCWLTSSSIANASCFMPRSSRIRPIFLPIWFVLFVVLIIQS